MVRFRYIISLVAIFLVLTGSAAEAHGRREGLSREDGLGKEMNLDKGESLSTEKSLDRAAQRGKTEKKDAAQRGKTEKKDAAQRGKTEKKDSVSIAVFGGSLSVNPPSQAAKDVWRQRLTASVKDYGVGGAGFSSLQGHSMQIQVQEASADHDIYILWASTNDFKKSRECGTWRDYTAEDGFDESKLTTQCGGINFCIKTILDKNPRARILFFTSLRFFSDPSGSSPFDADANATGKTFAEYVAAQIDCCRHYGIPVLDLFSLQGVNELNYKAFYLKDKLHMTEDGYRFIAPLQASFIEQFL